MYRRRRLTSSIAVGLCAGFYPAWRAARLDPVEAVRHDDASKQAHGASGQPFITAQTSAPRPLFVTWLSLIGSSSGMFWVGLIETGNRR